MEHWALSKKRRTISQKEKSILNNSLIIPSVLLVSVEVISIVRNSGYFAPVINCQRNLISKMADKNDRSQGKRIPCDFLKNLSSVDLFYEEKSWNETPCKKM